MKSHKYTEVDSTDGTRTIFYAKVSLGKEATKKQKDDTLTSAPLGFHSVVAIRPGFKEYIVYRYGQALPYLKITYKV